MEDRIEYRGALKSPDDPDDFIFERIACAPTGFYFAELPEEFDLRRLQREARDQGPRSTSAAFAAAVIKEIQEYKDCDFDKLMSPEFIYFHRDNKPASGMYGRNVFQILQKIGCVPEDDYPYYDSETAPRPDERLYCIAAKYRIANYARVTTIVGLKRALLEIGPCYIQLPLYSMDVQFWKPPVTAAPDVSVPSGGHALVVVGYTTEGFILVNSWGPDWGTNGSVIFPYDDWSAHWECWASIDEKTSSSPVCVSKRTGSVINRNRRKKHSISIGSIRGKKSKSRRYSDRYIPSSKNAELDEAKCIVM